MSTYTRLGFKAYYNNPVGPFADTLAFTVTGLTMQQLAADIADSALFQDQSVNTDQNFFENDDFVSNTNLTHGWSSTSAGAGTGLDRDAYGLNSTERAIGTFGGKTGTTAAGYATMYKGVSSLFTGWGVFLRCRMRAAVETLSTGAERFTTYVGFGDNVATGDMAEGCYFRYTDSVNSGKWEAVTAKASVKTAVDTGVAANTQYSIFEVRINAAGTSVEYYINDVLVATITTNIPVSPFGMIHKIEKSVGTTSRRFHMDWFDFIVSLSAAR